MLAAVGLAVYGTFVVPQRQPPEDQVGALRPVLTRKS
jgi:hypothetical protein